MLAFLVLHATAAALHLANGIAGTVLLNRATISYPLVFSRIEYTTDATEASACPIRFAKQPVFGTKDGVVCSAARFDGALLLVVSEFVTAAWHILYIVNLVFAGCRPFFNPFKRGWNPLRAAEYAVTATCLSLANLVGVGARDVGTVAIGCSALVAVQGLGAIAEAATAKLRKKERKQKSGSAFYRGVQIFSFALGCVLQGTVFLVAFLYVNVVSDPAPPREERFDGFSEQVWVYTIQYLSFPAIAFLYAFAPRYSAAADFRFIEYLYLLAGVFAKVSIFWMVFGTVRELLEEYYEVLPRSNINWHAVREFAKYLPSTLNLALSFLGFAQGFARTPIVSFRCARRLAAKGEFKKAIELIESEVYPRVRPSDSIAANAHKFIEDAQDVEIQESRSGISRPSRDRLGKARIRL